MNSTLFWTSHLKHRFHPVAVLIFLEFFIRHAGAQFIQDWQWLSVQGEAELQPHWRPVPTDNPERIFKLSDETVFLEYNCYYMTAICQNANQFIISARNRQRQWRTAFAYDGAGTARSDRRRKHRLVCPSGAWKRRHPCPERAGDGNLGQPLSWNNKGQWPTVELENPNDPKVDNTIRSITDAKGNRIPSGLMYSCDEFPPASWIEGGGGRDDDPPVAPEGNGAPAFTRCAAISCAGGSGGEQNWQGEIHGDLGSYLTEKAEEDALDNGRVYDQNKNPVLFFFRMIRDDNQIAARVWSRANNGQEEVEAEVSVGKRSIDGAARRNQTWKEYMDWADTVTIATLRSQGAKEQVVIYANDTRSDMLSIDSLFPSSFAQDQSEMGFLGSRDSGLALNVSTVKDVHEEANSAPPVAVHYPRSPGKEPHFRRVALAMNDTSPQTVPLVKNVTSSELDRARQLVEDAIVESGKRNAARYARPRRNRYHLKPGTVLRRAEDDEGEAPPLLEITPELAAAAALVSEADAVKLTPNLTTRAVAASAAGGFWMETIARKGTVPWGDDPDYKVFRNVRDPEFGAVGDGITDDTKAINKAISSGGRCGEKCHGSTTKNAIVYLPPGKYRVSTPIKLFFGTQIIGDANDWPTIVAADRFIGLGVLSTDEYTGGGIGIDGRDQEWYVNTANFYRQMRNLRIDITATRPQQEVAGIHYQVAQATSMQNVEVIAKPGTAQVGIFAENGSGGGIADVSISGGATCFFGGNQQFTAQRLKLEGCSTAVHTIWDWGWIWKSVDVKNVDVGFKLLPEEEKDGGRRKRQAKKENGNIGSASFMDSTFSNVGTAILIGPPNDEPGANSTGVILDNVKFDGVQKAVADSSGNTLLSSTGSVDHWVIGPVYSPDREFVSGRAVDGHNRIRSLLDSSGRYYERSKPQYESTPASSFVHLKDTGAKGDGVTDDTAAVQAALDQNVGRIIFVDAGTYLLTSTVTIPSGTKLVGEAWAQFAAFGQFFADASDPQVMIKVGAEGEVGKVEMQDLLFTTKGPTAGAILVQWNIKALSNGAAALWDCHVRVGGATGTGLTPDECPPRTDGINDNCQAASLMMHISPKASGYFENMWLWVADHMIDDTNFNDANNTMIQTSIYVARGLLVESKSSTWLYGTAAEHATLYQYNFHKARNVFAGMIQTESPYYQPTPEAPAPFDYALGTFPGDPVYDCDGGDFDGCDSSWAVIMRGSQDVFIAAAGLYSWFSTYTQDCIDEHACQKVLMLLEENGINVSIQHLITIGAEYMLVQDGEGILALDNLNVKDHPSWSQISIFDASGDELPGDDGSGDLIWIDPSIWDEDNPTIWCPGECTLQLPPWTKATSTIDYPIMTVSDGTWTTVLTRRPITVSQWVFDPITVNGPRRLPSGITTTPLPPDTSIPSKTSTTTTSSSTDIIAIIWPVFASTTTWPPITYKDKSGKPTTTRHPNKDPTHPPPLALPTPPGPPGPPGPPPPGPSPPPPPTGSLPPVPITIKPGPAKPTVKTCFFPAFQCPPIPGDPDGPNGAVDPEDEPDEEDPEDALMCLVDFLDPDDGEGRGGGGSGGGGGGGNNNPAPPAPPPPERADFSKNEKHCYGFGGQHTSGAVLRNAINSFCKNLGANLGGSALTRSDGLFERKYEQNFDLAFAAVVEVIASVEVTKDKCEWEFSSDECKKYLSVLVDDCGDVIGEPGGWLQNNCLKWRLDANRA